MNLGSPGIHCIQRTRSKCFHVLLKILRMRLTRSRPRMSHLRNHPEQDDISNDSFAVPQSILAIDERLPTNSEYLGVPPPPWPASSLRGVNKKTISHRRESIAYHDRPGVGVGVGVVCVPGSHAVCPPPSTTARADATSNNNNKNRKPRPGKAAKYLNGSFSLSAVCC